MKRTYALFLAASILLILSGILQSCQKAEPNIDEIKLMANQGDLDAQNRLAAAYLQGKGVEKNPGEAQRWFRQAAEKGYAKAQYNLGVLYFTGQGVPQNHAEAFQWFSRAAGQGLADAQYNLGVMYYQGSGVQQSYAEAFDLYSRASRQGHALAEYNLGLMYLQGNGVPKDYLQAYMWLYLAAGQKVQEAAGNLDYLAARMTPGQIAEAQKTARDFKPQK
jgi:uncharacterized protein